MTSLTHKYKPSEKQGDSKLKIGYAEIAGFLDADGSLSVSILDRRKRNPKTSVMFGFEIKIEMTQADYNASVFELINTHLGTHTTLNTDSSSRLKIYWTSPAGQQLVKFLKENLPQVPNKRLDFLIILEIQELLRQARTKANTIAILHLIYKMSNQSKTDTQVIQRRTDLNTYLQDLGATKQELLEGRTNADTIYKKIDLCVQKHIADLPKSKLPKDYLTGFFWGDGGITISFKKTKTVPRIVYPSFTITEPSKPFLEAVRSTFNGVGSIQPVGANKNCFQYRVTTWKSFNTVIFPFLDSGLHPSYFFERIEKLKKFACLVENKIHLTADGWREIVTEGYSMCKNSKRTDPLDVIINDNINYYNARDNQSET